MLQMLFCSNRVVEDMRNLDRMKDEYADIQIPISVLKYAYTSYINVYIYPVNYCPPFSPSLSFKLH